ncbi:MAG: hypothetical protein ACPG80_03325, partial [Rickettsiales bacterium]
MATGSKASATSFTQKEGHEGSNGTKSSASDSGGERVIYSPFSQGSSEPADSKIALKSLLQKHAAVDPSSPPPLRSEALKHLLAEHASITASPALQNKMLDLSYLVDRLNGEVQVKFLLSNANAGILRATGNHDVEISFNNEDGTFLISGSAKAVAELLSSLHFTPNVKDAASFYLDIQV